MVVEQEKDKEPVVEYAYYPGCSLHGMAMEFDSSVKEMAQVLGIELTELPDWNCCGASSAHMTNHKLAVDLAVRNLQIAKQVGKDVVVPCAACFSRLKAGQKALRQEAAKQGKETAEVSILHVGDLFRSPEAIKKIRDAVKFPLKGLKLVPYYGCLITRPPAVTDSEETEDPKSMDLLIKILGGELMQWSYKTECCGGSMTLPRADMTAALVSRLVKAAAKAGAQGIVTMCPMCQGNLETRQMDLKREDPNHPAMPIYYASELVAACTSNTEQPDRWKTHLIDPGTSLVPSGGLVGTIEAWLKSISGN